MYNFGETNDTFCEQLVTMPRDGKYYGKFFGIWAAAFVIVWLLVMTFLRQPQIGGLLFLCVAGVFFGAFKLTARLYTEYEYIVVNKDLDIDKISGKSSRKRLITVKLNEVEEIGIYNADSAARLSGRTFSETVLCAEASEECYYIVVKHQKRGTVLVIASFNDKLLDAVKSGISRINWNF